MTTLSRATLSQEPPNHQPRPPRIIAPVANSQVFSQDTFHWSKNKRSYPLENARPDRGIAQSHRVLRQKLCTTCNRKVLVDSSLYVYHNSALTLEDILSIGTLYP